jgi:hypothetical protein
MFWPTGDWGRARLGHKLAIRTIYLIHSNRFRSKGELGRVDDAAHHDRHAIKRRPPEYEAIAPAWEP